MTRSSLGRQGERAQPQPQRHSEVSRTIALGSVAEGSADIQAEQVGEAIQYRSLDRNLWA